MQHEKWGRDKDYASWLREYTGGICCGGDANADGIDSITLLRCDVQAPNVRDLPRWPCPSYRQFPPLPLSCSALLARQDDSKRCVSRTYRPRGQELNDPQTYVGASGQEDTTRLWVGWTERIEGQLDGPVRNRVSGLERGNLTGFQANGAPRGGRPGDVSNRAASRSGREAGRGWWVVRKTLKLRMSAEESAPNRFKHMRAGRGTEDKVLGGG